MIRNRQLFGLIGLSCFSLVGFAIVLQYVESIEPCPMCIIQRYAFLMIALTSLVAFIHNPNELGVKIYSLLIFLLSLLGAGVATRHVYLEIHPPEIFDCGADLDYLIDAFPLAKMLPMVFRGTGDCSEILWTFMGLSIAGWALIWFLIFAGLAIFIFTLRPNDSN